MQKGTKSELQMLREVGWLVLAHLKCRFCKNHLLERPANMTFGHRRHPPITVKLSVHHIKHDRDKNKTTAIFAEEIQGDVTLVHKSCHERFHANLRRTSESELDESPQSNAADC